MILDEWEFALSKEKTFERFHTENNGFFTNVLYTLYDRFLNRDLDGVLTGYNCFDVELRDQSLFVDFGRAAGNSTSIINYINNHPDQKFGLITPRKRIYLDVFRDSLDFDNYVSGSVNSNLNKLRGHRFDALFFDIGLEVYTDKFQEIRGIQRYNHVPCVFNVSSNSLLEDLRHEDLTLNLRYR